MPDETAALLNINPRGVYLDCTLGGGGHAEAILDRLAGGRLVGIDRDAEAIAAAGARLAGRGGFTAVKGNFHDARAVLGALGIVRIDGALMDLGVSSRQLDTAGRGFSYRLDGPLDMRMDADSPVTAASLLNGLDEAALAKILFEYGEERRARKIARAIARERSRAPIESTAQLAAIVGRALPGSLAVPAMRTFMALRIAVNDELAPLGGAIADIAEMLLPGGRVAALSFHSLEDRIVKNTFRKLESPCECPRGLPVCACGKVPQAFVVTKKPALPSKAEIERNPRARSAKLRVAERL